MVNGVSYSGDGNTSNYNNQNTQQPAQPVARPMEDCRQDAPF